MIILLFDCPPPPDAHPSIQYTAKPRVRSTAKIITTIVCRTHARTHMQSVPCACQLPHLSLTLPVLLFLPSSHFCGFSAAPGVLLFSPFLREGKGSQFLDFCIDARLYSRLWHNILIALSLSHSPQCCEICDRMTLHRCDGLIEYQYSLQYQIVHTVNLISPEPCISLASCDLFVWPRSETKHRHQSRSPAERVAWAPGLWSPFYFDFFSILSPVLQLKFNVFFLLKYSRKLQKRALVGRKMPEWLCLASVWHYGKKGDIKVATGCEWEVAGEVTTWCLSGVYTSEQSCRQRQPLTPEHFSTTRSPCLST